MKYVYVVIYKTNNLIIINDFGLITYSFQEDAGEDVIENPEEVLQECLEKFKTPDYIMEPGIFGQLKRYFQAGGNPEQVIEQLSINYNAVAQMANLLAEWLILGGTPFYHVFFILAAEYKGQHGQIADCSYYRKDHKKILRYHFIDDHSVRGHNNLSQHSQ